MVWEDYLSSGVQATLGGLRGLCLKKKNRFAVWRYSESFLSCRDHLTASLIS